MKKLSIFAFALFIPTSAFAQSGVRIEDDIGRFRIGASCSLSFYGQNLVGRCTIGRGYDSLTTFINAGDAQYKIVRDYDNKYSGYFYQLAGGKSRPIGPVSARGNCWAGSGVKFCAN
jgi:hypothetical protein